MPMQKPKHFRHAEHFFNPKKKKRRSVCKVCPGGRFMQHQKAIIHENTKDHLSNVAATFFTSPTSFDYVGDGGWRCTFCNAYARSYKDAMAHEVQCMGQIRDSSLQVAPRVTPYTGQNAVNTLLSSQWWSGSSTRNVASLPEGLEAAERDLEAESLLEWLDDRREGNSNATSRHREGRAFERTNDDDEDENENENEDEDDNNNDNDNADDNDDSGNIDATFVENFVHCHILDTSRGERM